MQTITGKTQLFGVIGHPVSHSLSPVMHNAVLRHLDLDYAYVAFPIAPENLKMAIAGLGGSGVKGLNVTIPHKQAVMPLLTTISETAQQVGAVNTLWMEPQGWQGTNTDVEGFIAPLKALDQPWHRIRPVILGNGGAARAVVVGLAQLGCPEIAVVGRNLEKLVAFHQSWQSSTLKSRVVIHPWDNLPSFLPQTRLLVNTTPIGMAPHIDQSPLSDALIAQLPPTAIAYDLIYTPRPTQFLKMAQRHGLKTIDGLEMLVQQGAAALKIWLERDIPTEVMAQALLDHRGEQD
ncbi:MAG: shikimate 5-dehydrogenase [Cyanobacteriota bacterium]|jgi:shikimate dehydrogenase